MFINKKACNKSTNMNRDRQKKLQTHINRYQQKPAKINKYREASTNINKLQQKRQIPVIIDWTQLLTKPDAQESQERLATSRGQRPTCDMNRI